MNFDNKLIDQLKQISYDAGSAIMDVYNSTDFDVEKKSDDSPLTKADKASNEIICAGLQRIDPSIPIISEENEMPDFDIRKEYETYWLIDPLDGTKEFVHRNGDFTTNIALIHKTKSVLGVVFVPVHNALYWAAEVKGAYKVIDGQETRISVRPYQPKDKGLTITCSRSHLNQATQDYINQYDTPKLQEVGSSLKLMLIAEGKADIYPRLGPISEWDIAASHIIVEEAGGRVSQYADGSEIRYNKENILMPYFIVEGKRVE